MPKNLEQQLYDAVFCGKPDWDKIKLLLQQGANPLIDFDERDCVLERVFLESTMSKTLNKNLPNIIGMFIDNGMNPSDIKAEYKDGLQVSPLWSLTFVGTKEAIETMKILIDNDLSTDALNTFISHFYMDAEMCDGSDIDENKKHREHVTNNLKIIMLAASYPTVLSTDEYLTDCLEMSTMNKENSYDLGKFRSYDDFNYKYDLSTGDNIPFGLSNVTVRIYEKKSGKLAWILTI